MQIFIKELASKFNLKIHFLWLNEIGKEHALVFLRFEQSILFRVLSLSRKLCVKLPDDDEFFP